MAGILLANCGGGGGGGYASGGAGGTGVSPSTVSGVAATGAPLAGGQVTLRDSSSGPKDKVTIVGSDGSFAIDVSNMTAPFVLKATGTVDGLSRTLYSFADGPGTANINPLSTVAVASAAGVSDPATFFDKPDAATMAKARSAMSSSVTTLQSKLKPLLDVFSASATNPVSDSFPADNTGLDGMFDNVNVALNKGTLTITNVTTGAVIFTSSIGDLAKGHLTERDDDLPHPSLRPSAPTGVKAVGGDGQVSIAWDPVVNATSYDLYYKKQTSKAAEENDDDDDGVHAMRLRNVTSPFVLTGLSANSTYLLRVRALNNKMRGPMSAQVSATTSATTPSPTIPAVPFNLQATGGTQQATVSWANVTGATSYNLYWSTTAGVTTSNGTKITGVTSPAVLTKLSDATTYYYVVTAVNSAGESAASAQATATTSAAAIDGAALYTQYCSGCHGSLATSDKRGATAAQITSGNANVSSMNTRFNATTGTLIKLTPAQIAEISAALQ